MELKENVEEKKVTTCRITGGIGGTLSYQPLAAQILIKMVVAD